MSIFLTGPFIGGGLALISGGLILHRMTTVLPSAIWSGFAPWQRTFMVVGAPGLLVALLLLSVREPARVVPVHAPDASFRLREVGTFLWNERAFYGRFFGGMALLIVGLYALPAWTPALLIRVYGGTPGRVGVEYGTATLIASSLGVLLGPWLSKRLSARYPDDSPLRTAVCAGLFAAPACLLLPFAPNYWTALVESVMGSFLLNFAIPVAAAALQASTPNRMRPGASATRWDGSVASPRFLPYPRCYARQSTMFRGSQLNVRLASSYPISTSTVSNRSAAT